MSLAQCIGALIIVFGAIFIYFMPATIANSRRHKELTSILVLNLLTGWTFIGWVIAIVWAFSSNVEAPKPVELPEYLR